MIRPEAVGVVNHLAVHDLIKPLIGVRLFQAAFVGEIRTEFDIIEVVDIGWFVVSAGIPSDFKVQDIFYVMSQLFDLVFRGVTTHDANTGDVALIHL